MMTDVATPLALDSGLECPRWSDPAGRGLFLHAAAIHAPEGAWLLLGHSSSGKTTLSTLLAACLPVIADDLVFAVPRTDGGWMVRDGACLKTSGVAHLPKYDTHPDNSSKWHPLHCIIRIFAARDTVMQPLTPLKTCGYLMDAVFEVDVQRTATGPENPKMWFRAAATIARKHPGWRLNFSLDAAQVMAVLQQTIGVDIKSAIKETKPVMPDPIRHPDSMTGFRPPPE